MVSGNSKERRGQIFIYICGENNVTVLSGT